MNQRNGWSWGKVLAILTGLAALAAILTFLFTYGGPIFNSVINVVVNYAPQQSTAPGQTNIVTCNDVPTNSAGVAQALNIDESLVGSPQASCGGGKPGGWQIDPNHTGVQATLQPGMCVDFDGGSTTFSDESALGWTVPQNWRGTPKARAYIIKEVAISSEGITVYWSPCQQQQP